MSVSEPGKIITPWAESGLKNPIPPAANPATGRAGFDQGFSAINMTAKEAGGIPPLGQDFNGIFYEVTNILRYMQAGGQPTFDAALATAIGGYPKGAMVLGSDRVTLWQSQIESNYTDPDLDPSNWGTFDIGLKADLAAPGGAGLVGIKAPFTNSVLRLLSDASLDRLSVKHWGAKGDGVTDETAAIQAACNDLQTAYAADGVRRTLVFHDGKYLTLSTIVVHANMCIDCSGRVVFQNKGTAKNFAAVELQGGAKKSVLGTIDAYGSGILIRGSTHNVEFQTISNCVDGVVIRADRNWVTKSSLDNVVRGVQIGKCTNGIVFEQNADKLVQQGNEVHANFVSETTNTLVFRNFDGFAHTVQSSWDSNFVELIASDPLTAPNAAIARNLTDYGVPNLTFSIWSWCGGWVPDAGTMCLIRGRFSTCTFTFNLAQRVGLNELVDAEGVNSFGSCMLHVPRYSNLGSEAAYYTAVTPGASFNDGVPLVNSKFRVRVTVPDLAPGQTFGSSMWHVLVQKSGTSRVRLDQYSDFARGKYLIELRDAGTELQGMVRIWITNIKSTTVTGGNIDLNITTC